MSKKFIFKRLTILLVCFLSVILTFSLKAQTDSLYLKVRVFTHRNLYSIQVMSQNGSYSVLNNGNKITELNQNLGITLKAGQKKVMLSKLNAVIGNFDTLYFIANSDQSLIRIKPPKEERKYNDHLIIYAEKGELIVLNRVRLEHFVAGAVLSETGSKESIEFYKIQALISRTYAIRNMRKHETEQFHQCDQVHCQLYRGNCSHETILKAVEETRGQVIVDSSGLLISAAFHSNSGGETTNSEDVWSLPSSYLKAVNDSFSVTMPMAKWEKKIPKKEWLNYLREKYKYPVHDSVKKKEVLHFKQDKRKTTLGDSIPLKAIRNDFKLRSTYFDINTQGDQVIFKGKGFGHGVGLSQEGAINMAKKGYHYEDIIRFYYKNVRICPFDTSMIPRKKL
jgi:stage II sporulation protein D